MSKSALFALSLFLTTGVLVTVIYLHRPKHQRPRLTRVDDWNFVTTQLHPDDFTFLRNRGIRTLVDLRPDGEAADQASSAEMGVAAKAAAIDFHYIPVPHEGIPDQAVAQLTEVTSRGPTQTVMYCRTGRRAVRTFALVKATQVDGPGVEEILANVRTAGFTAEDLRENITTRIAARKLPQPAIK